MKPEITLLSFSFFIFLILISFMEKLPSARAEPVIDTDGEYMNPGQAYYVVSPMWGGGLSLGNSGSGAGCPVDVVQDSSPGKPITVSDIDGDRVKYVYSGRPVGLTFSAKPVCVNSSQWVGYRDLDGLWVGVGGPQDHPCSRFMNGNFMIQKQRYDYGYNLVFCPDQDHRHHSRGCSNVGIEYDEENGSRRLSLDTHSKPFTILFVKADDSHRAKSFDYIKQILTRHESI